MEPAMSLENPFQYGFMERAAIAAALLSLVSGLISPPIVLRRLAFAADGLAHASLGGLAIGLCFVPGALVPTLTSYGVSFAFTCAAALLIGFLSTRVPSDTAVGACYVAAFSLGILLLNYRHRGSGHLEHFFFGSLLAANPLEIALLSILTLLITLAIGCTWRWIAMWMFDEELAQANGVPVRALRYSLLLIIAATVILATRMVGVLLVAALLVLPGATGSQLATRASRITGVSLLVAFASTSSGLAWSNAANVPPGPAITLVAFVLFAASLGFRRFRKPSQPLDSTAP